MNHRAPSRLGVDRQGYRKNVGIIVCNRDGRVLWARRVRRDGWQFPQGGVKPLEPPIDAAFRELREEVGLQGYDVHLLGATDRWLKYEVPYAGAGRAHGFRGQKQRWFLFQLITVESRVRLDVSATPEFDRWCWVDYWRPVQQVVAFKKEVYRKALTELEPSLAQMYR